ncbi:MAG: hypothetical protein KBA55_07975 [Ruminococcus sp.]|nr:hypothetical protein [Ruminococcus sp.]
MLTAVLFSAALNLNGCVYGPPPEEEMYSAPSSEITETSPTDETEADTQLTEAASDERDV